MPAPSATSASERARRFFREAPYLWITTRRRASAALLAAVLVLGPAVAFELSPSWRLLALGRPTPATPEAAVVMASLAEARAGGTDIVLLVGGSTSREFSPSDARMSALLSRRCGGSIRFVDAATSNQGLAQAWAIAETLRGARLRLVVVGVNYERLGEGYGDVEKSLPIRGLPLAAPAALRAQLERSGHAPDLTLPTFGRTAWMLRNAGGLAWRGAARSFAALVASEAPADRYQGRLNGYGAPAQSLAVKALTARRIIVEVIPQVRAVHDQATALWTGFLRRFSDPSSRVLFLVLPQSAAMAPVDALAGRLLRDDLDRLGRGGALIEDLRADSGLAESDIFDQQHLLASGRARIEPRFVETIARALPGCR